MSSPEPPSGTVGSLSIDGFNNFELIGVGGFARVYRARESAFDRDVAIKILSVGIVSADTQRRFERECKAIGALSAHPNIVTVFGAGTSGEGQPYIVMEMMPGGSLTDRLHRYGAFNCEEAVSYGQDLASAIHEAHEAGVLHRDIKPDNVLISRYGRPKLADFGISSIPGGFETRSGNVTATIGYAAPEVIDGKPASPSSDVYSLAATLVAMITGKPMFERCPDESLFALIPRILKDPPPNLTDFGASPALEAALHRALGKAADNRFRHADEFAAALATVPEAAHAGGSGAARPLGSPRMPSQGVQPSGPLPDAPLAEPTTYKPRSAASEEPPAKSRGETGADRPVTGIAASAGRGMVAEPTVLRGSLSGTDAQLGRPAGRFSRKWFVGLAVALLVLAGAGALLAVQRGGHQSHDVMGQRALSPLPPLPIARLQPHCRGFTCSLRYTGEPLAAGERLRWQFGDGHSSVTTSRAINHTYPGAGNYHATLTVLRGSERGRPDQRAVNLKSWTRGVSLRRAHSGSRTLLVRIHAVRNRTCQAAHLLVVRRLGRRWVPVSRGYSTGASGSARITLSSFGIYRVVIARSNLTGGECTAAASNRVELKAVASNTGSGSTAPSTTSVTPSGSTTPAPAHTSPPPKKVPPPL
jgi:serine/threonine protein kinase